jgi:hypothetical protein
MKKLLMRFLVGVVALIAIGFIGLRLYFFSLPPYETLIVKNVSREKVDAFVKAYIEADRPDGSRFGVVASSESYASALKAGDRFRVIHQKHTEGTEADAFHAWDYHGKTFDLLSVLSMVLVILSARFLMKQGE